jgi:hypothetical protein
MSMQSHDGLHRVALEESIFGRVSIPVPADTSLQYPMTFNMVAH